VCPEAGVGNEVAPALREEGDARERGGQFRRGPTEAPSPVGGEAWPAVADLIGGPIHPVTRAAGRADIICWNTT
jgi:hypothetical protein